jgi:hypothetical protein
VISSRGVRTFVSSLLTVDDVVETFDRRRIEEACGDLVAHRAREHTDPMSSAIPAAARERWAAPPPSPEANQLLLDFKQRYYANWLDQSIPALHGLSPREAVRTAEGRLAVDALLKDIENREDRMSGGTAFDVSPLRRALHLG